MMCFLFPSVTQTPNLIPTPPTNVPGNNHGNPQGNQYNNNHDNSNGDPPPGNQNNNNCEDAPGNQNSTPNLQAQRDTDSKAKGFLTFTSNG
jgi:hypothetical protein